MHAKTRRGSAVVLASWPHLKVTRRQPNADTTLANNCAAVSVTSNSFWVTACANDDMVISSFTTSAFNFHWAVTKVHVGLSRPGAHMGT